MFFDYDRLPGVSVAVKMTKKAVLGILLFVFITGSSAFGEDPAPKDTNKNYASRPYCGLYCLYSVLKMEGQTVDFRKLVTTHLPQ